MNLQRLEYEAQTAQLLARVQAEAAKRVADAERRADERMARANQEVAEALQRVQEREVVFQAAVEDHARINTTWAVRYSEQGKRVEEEVARRTEAAKDAETIRKNDIALCLAAAREQWDREDAALRERAQTRGRNLNQRKSLPIQRLCRTMCIW